MNPSPSVGRPAVPAGWRVPAGGGRTGRRATSRAGAGGRRGGDGRRGPPRRARPLPARPSAARRDVAARRPRPPAAAPRGPAAGAATATAATSAASRWLIDHRTRRVQLRRPDEELAGGQREVVGHPPDVGRGRPAGELRRHGRAGSGLGGCPLADDHRARGEVAEALARLFAREQNSAGIPSSSQISTNSMSARTSACRNRIDPPSSRTARSPRAYFPIGPASGEGLEHERVADDHPDDDHEDEGRRGGVVERAAAHASSRRAARTAGRPG